MNTKRLTMAQAIIAFLKNQYVERDGKEQLFFAGCFGIFGHGNVAGIGQALQQTPIFAITRPGMNRRWCIRLLPTPKQKIACRHWSVPLPSGREPPT